MKLTVKAKKSYDVYIEDKILSFKGLFRRK